MISSNGRASCPLPGYWVCRRGNYYGPFSTFESAQDRLVQHRVEDNDYRYKQTGLVMFLTKSKASTQGSR